MTTELPTPAPLSLTGIFKSVSLTSAESKIVSTAQAKIADAVALIAATEPDRFGRISQLHLDADTAEQAFLADTSRENAERFHDALVRCRDAEVSFSRIDAICNLAMRAASQSVRDVAESVVTRASENLESEAAAHRAAMVKAAATFGEDRELGAFDLRLAATRAALADEAAEARRDPLHWLTQRGLA